MSVITCADRALPRDLDVQVQVSKTQVEATTDLSVMVAVVKTAPFTHGADRIRYYSSIEAVEGDFVSTDEALVMAQAFFSQSPRSETLAIAKAFETDQTGFLVTGDLGTQSDFVVIADGEFTISIDGDEQDITGLDFTSILDLDDMAAVIQTALQAVATGGFTASTAVIDGGRLKITSGTSGDLSAVSNLTPVSGGGGTDISGEGFLDGLLGNTTVVGGYTNTGIQNELELISEAARCSGRFVYGWALEKSYRDTPDQVTASTFMQSRVAILGLVSNSETALDPAFTGDIGSLVSASGDRRTFVFYSETPVQYPEVATLARALAVDYQGENSTITMKFKDLIGITPSGVTETELSVLENKRYNVFARVGNNARVVREGVEANETYFIDDLINLDNYREELQVAVYNVFLRNGKVAYNETGVALLRDAMDKISRLYVFNGTFSPRRVLDTSREAGFRIDPAFLITNTPLELIPLSDRANRVGPPFTIDANLTGAIHEVSINVNAFA